MVIADTAGVAPNENDGFGASAGFSTGGAAVVVPRPSKVEQVES